MELEEEGLAISVSLVKPGSIDTPFFEKARTVFDVEPQPVPPVYAPEVVANAILECAERPVRDVVVGGMGKLIQAANLAPRLADRYMERASFRSQLTSEPVTEERRDNLYEPVPNDGGERGRTWTGPTKETSLYTWAALHPQRALLLAAGLGVVGAGLRSMRGRKPNGPASNDQP
jgi:hypothetical protein